MGANNFLSKTVIVGTQKFSIVDFSRLKNMTCQLIKLEFLVPTAISQHQEQTPMYIMSNSIVSCYIKRVFNFSRKVLNSKASRP